MRYHKIRGRSVAECMMKLRSNFGPDAIILEHREINEGGLLGSGLFSHKSYEIEYMLPEKGKAAKGSSLFPASAKTADNENRGLGGLNSLDRASLSPLQSALLALDQGEQSSAKGSKDPQSSIKSSSKNSRGYKAHEDQSMIRKFLSEAGKAKKAKAAEPPSPLPDFIEAPESIGPMGSVNTLDALNPLEEDFRSARREGAPIFSSFSKESPPQQARDSFARPSLSTGGLRQTGAISASAYKDNSILHIGEQLSSAQLSPAFTSDFLRHLEDSLSRKEKSEYRIVEQKSLKLLSELIQTQPSRAPVSGECRALMLIGPTGAGKTTTLAKLAARFHIIEKRAVSLYSLDHYRLAATEQLKTYANVMNIDFSAPLSKEEFAESLRRDGAELVLIDSSGVSHSDQERLSELGAYLEVCRQEMSFVETHLVLAANMNPSLLGKILRSYESLGFDKILLTKVDETDFIGAFVEFADSFKRPFSFVTDGQEVPSDIRDADAKEIATMLLGPPLESPVGSPRLL